ncbi:hypothetical protein [Halorhabdus amylolytica]|uniref:hypothetical protein n=1 Tax=Halorhabdus amylolytica TaxID=2559573 RepID=UPI0010AA375E|nr:hypothetical protein [Halorhabdus amylolytica]
MSDVEAIDQHRKTALDSPYSRDREEAIEALTTAFPSADERDQQRIAETLREVALESAHRDERELAKDRLFDCFENESGTIDTVLVGMVTEIATESKFSEERLEAIDALREIYSEIGEHQRDVVGKTLAEIAGNATREEERRKARRRLSDVARTEREECDTSDKGADEAVDYLGESLAEHLENAATKSREACLQRAEELFEFLDEQPLDDGSYEEVREDVKELMEALEIVDSETLADDRIERVERISERTKRLYARA